MDCQNKQSIKFPKEVKMGPEMAKLYGNFVFDTIWKKMTRSNFPD